MSMMNARDLEDDEFGRLVRELIGQVALLRRELVNTTTERDDQTTHVRHLTDMVCAHEEALAERGWNPATREWKQLES